MIEIDLSKQQAIDKLILLEIQIKQDKHRCISLLKKQKKPF